MHSASHRSFAIAGRHAIGSQVDVFLLPALQSVVLVSGFAILHLCASSAV